MAAFGESPRGFVLCSTPEGVREVSIAFRALLSSGVMLCSTPEGVREVSIFAGRRVQPNLNPVLNA